MFLTALLGPHADVGTPVAFCDTNRTRMAYHQRLRQQEAPGAAPLPEYGPEDFGTMLTEQRVDAVVVTVIDRLHARFVCEALDHGCDVICEKPLTIDVEGCRQITEAVARSSGRLVVTFNYRYSPRNSAVRRLLLDGEIGEVTSVHFEWLLDTVHGADYFRRWHRDKANSGGLLVHKATHHFDLLNWWLDDLPETVYAQAELRFYGAANAAARGLGPRPRRSSAQAAAGDPFALDLTASPRLRQLYLEAEQEDGYHRDLDVFSDGITIEDTMAVLARYTRGALLTYSLTAHAPWEGYRVAFNGTAGRLELSVCERASLAAASAGDVVGWERPAVDPSATDDRSAADRPGDVPPADHDEAAPHVPGDTAIRAEGTELVLQRHWEPPRRIDVASAGAHGGGDELLLHDVFRGTAADPLGRRAGHLDGIRSVLVGIAANRSAETGLPVLLGELGVPVTAPVTAQEEADR